MVLQPLVSHVDDMGVVSGQELILFWMGLTIDEFAELERELIQDKNSSVILTQHILNLLDSGELDVDSTIDSDRLQGASMQITQQSQLNCYMIVLEHRPTCSFNEPHNS